MDAQMSHTKENIDQYSRFSSEIEWNKQTGNKGKLKLCLKVYIKKNDE